MDRYEVEVQTSDGRLTWAKYNTRAEAVEGKTEAREELGRYYSDARFRIVYHITEWE